eukprot:27716-Eustigmatos_ZCMA.PRE.1
MHTAAHGYLYIPPLCVMAWHSSQPIDDLMSDDVMFRGGAWTRSRDGPGAQWYRRRQPRSG